MAKKESNGDWGDGRLDWEALANSFSHLSEKGSSITAPATHMRMALCPAGHPVPVHIIDEPPPFIVPEVDHRHVAFADGVGLDAAVEHEVSNRIERVIPVQAVLEHGASIVHDLVKVEGDGVRGKVVRPILHDYGESLFRLFFDVLEELVFPFHWRAGDGQAVRNDQHAIGIEGVRTELPFGFEGYGEDFLSCITPR